MFSIVVLHVSMRPRSRSMSAALVGSCFLFFTFSLAKARRSSGLERHQSRLRSLGFDRKLLCYVAVRDRFSSAVLNCNLKGELRIFILGHRVGDFYLLLDDTLRRRFLLNRGNDVRFD